MIKCIFTDIDNTLLDFQKCAASSIKSGFADWSLPYDDGVFPTFERINNGLWLQIENKTLTLDELHRVRWQRIFAELGIEADSEAFEWVFVKYLDESCDTVDGAEELCRYLSSKYVLCAASNAPYEQQRYRLEKAGLLPYFSHLFISEDVGFPKPGKEFFDECFRRLDNVSPEETVMIGDSLTADINGGADYGLTTVWYRHKKEAVPTDCRADHSVTRLEEIRDIF